MLPIGNLPRPPLGGLVVIVRPIREILSTFGYLIENKYKLDTSNLLVFNDK